MMLKVLGSCGIGYDPGRSVDNIVVDVYVRLGKHWKAGPCDAVATAVCILLR
jgi:hypothetical protein